ncbi:hypothetical protein TTHERM_00010940 (macronuclear) [Tetrahymena thermophila SB210]|uniref:Calpain family cysteine protease n=1 Tax=Tetrahymena thermophila (strain SB210) TaxID=312017 RepID=Q22S38_TETTS|nr:hypothetical protein TTHERM_00010940 [Tetrahymena thermophila SB210]EAR87934.2 hypothetical protein TTHERM_00010940 [Tetrahymena thermophila SB210]|eukprot:XP_001008179.2 hypothetical protein TTHERM_00010940 [Tetrahymena thermophila SB210]
MCLTQKINFKLILVLCFKIHLIVSQIAGNQGLHYIYAQQYLNQLHQNISNWSPLMINVATQNSLVYVSTGYRGISIIDQLGSQTLFNQNIGNDYIQLFQITKNGEYIFIGFQEYLVIYKVNFYNQSNIQSCQLLQQISQQTPILSLIYRESSEILITAAKQGLIVAYDTSNKSNCKQIGFISLNSEIINSLFISQDGLWLYVAADSIGMQVYQLKDTWNNNTSQLNSSQNGREINFTLAAYAKFDSELMQIQATSTNYIYGFGKYEGFFFSTSQLIIQANQNQFPVLINFNNYWPYQSIQPVIQSMLINKEETILLLGVRSQGLYIFDISQKNTIKLLQIIDFDFPIYSMQFSNSENYLYLSNGQSLITLNSIEVNLNNDFPNIYNYHQIKFDQFQGKYKWRCYTDPSDTYLIGNFDSKGIFVFPYYQNPYRLNISNFQNYIFSQDSLEIDSSDKYLIIPQYGDTTLIGVYQYKPLDNSPEQQIISPMNMKEVKKYYANFTYVSEMMTFSYDKTFAVQTYAVGLILYNSTDILNMYVYTFWQYPDFLSGENQGACITKDNKWVISTIRFVAIYLLNVQNKTNPILANYQINLGGEAIFISQFYDYAYLVDGIKGFAIIDTTSFPNINIISRVNLQGYTVMLLLLEQENYVLLTQVEKGLISLIDISDKLFPQIIASITYESQTAQAICSNKNNSYIFLGATTGIITMPLQSDVLIHTDAYLIAQGYGNRENQIKQLIKKQSANGTNSPSIQNEYIFYIGQIVKFDFTILYLTAQNTHIKNVLIYQEGQMVNLPSYFIFDLPSQSLQVTVNQELGGNNQNEFNLNIILLWTVIPLDQNSFIYSAEDSLDIAVTNSNQSAIIFQYLIDQNILDSAGIINSQYDFTKNVKLDSQLQSQILDPSSMTIALYQILMDALALKINLSLKKSCYVNPIKYYVKSSLQFDNNNTTKFISSIEEQNISVTLQISSQDGKLVPINQNNVITYMQTNQDQLKIQGALEDVNSVLSNKIIFANNTEITQKNSPNITITIVDNINYPLIKTYSIYQSNFIVLKKQLKVNEQNKLQYQIEQQYQGAIVDINSNVDISFSSNTFFVEDSQSLNYEVFLFNQNGQYEHISSGFWLQQQNNKLNFKGQTTSKLYGNIYRFKIQASDGYTTAEDYFYIAVQGIPFLYIFNLMLTILGPAAAAFGIYKKRFSLYNIIFKDYVTFSEEEIFCGQVYHKEIIALGQTQQIAQEIVNCLFKTIINRQSIDQVIDQVQSQDKYVKSGDKNLTESQFSEKEQMSNFENENKLLQGKNEVRRLRAISILSKINTHSQKTIFEKKYLHKTGNLVFSRVIDDIIKFKIHPNKHMFESEEIYQREITNMNSRIHRCIRALISRHFLNLDKRTLQVYDYIKNYCIENYNKTQYDWSKAIVQINYVNNQEDYLQSIMNFPQLQLAYSQLIKILQDIKLLPFQLKENISKFKDFVNLIQTHQVNINPFILREVIFAQTLGFSNMLVSKFYPSTGLSIHLNAYEISQVVAFKKRHINKWIKPLYKILNMEYTRYGISKNIKLPQWIYLDQKHGKIFLHGIPQDYDIEDILIRIYDRNNYVVQQFLLKIKYNLKNDEDNRKQNKDDIYSVADEQEEYKSIVQNEIMSQTNINLFKFSSNSPLNMSSLLQERELMLTNQTPQLSKLGSLSIKSKQISSPIAKNKYNFRIHSNSKNSFLLEQTNTNNTLVNNINTSEENSIFVNFTTAIENNIDLSNKNEKNFQDYSLNVANLQQKFENQMDEIIE